MTTNHHVRAVIWDMGGVLVRNLAPEPRNRLAKKYGLTEPQLENLVFANPVAPKATIGEVPVEALWDYVARTLNIYPQDLPGFITAFWSSDRMDEELVDFIQTLHLSYKIGLLSNAFSDTRQSLMARFPRLLPIFDVSIFSCEVGLAKPDPRFYRLILDKLGVMAEEAVFIDDFVENVEGAQALGIKAVHFKNTQQARQAVLEKLSSNGAE